MIEALSGQPGCRLARMSGSGATCFGVFDDAAAAARAAPADLAPDATRVVGDQHGDPRGVIVLCTDFGLEGPYTGQVKAVLARTAPAVPVIDLFADLPAFRPQLAAYLLAAYGEAFMAGDVILAVVDPGVGGPRAALAIEADGRWYVGPDNGLFEIVLRRAHASRCWRIEWQPATLPRVSTGATCSRRSPRSWRLGRPHPLRRPRRRVTRIGPMIWPRSSTSTATAMP